MYQVLGMAPKNKKSAKKASKKSVEAPEIPDNFVNLIVDFTRDLSTTFPEFSHLWQQWSTLDIPEPEVRHLFDYCLTVFPERFFDILYQNEDIFKPESTINTVFLPGVDFKTLYHCENVSENTRKAIWKYLQVILLASLNSVKDKAGFGDAMNMFDGINENDLQSKLSETISGISEFFTPLNIYNGTPGGRLNRDLRATLPINELKGNPPSEGCPILNLHRCKMGKMEEEDEDEDVEDIPYEGDGSMPNAEEFAKTFDFSKMAGSMPNAEDLHGHLKGLFDGKIGSLAKEMAEEISKDFEGILGGDGDDMRSTQDMLKNMMKNPKKIMELMKTVGAKLNSKMDSGDISKDDLMKEAAEWIGKMKDMGGSDQFGELFKNLTKNMGGLGKNMRFDESALNRLTKTQSTKDKMRNRLAERKAAAEEVRQQAMAQAQKTKAAQNSVLEATAPNNYVFRVDGDGPQEKSVKKSKAEMDKEIDDLVASIGIENTEPEKPKSKSKKSKGKK